ncbi:MAG: DUF559 domain-containing protein [Chitinophagales bacterium]
MNKIPVIAILDVGKTNKKLLLFDREYHVVHEESRNLNEIKDEDGFPCEDVATLTNWVKEVFGRISSDERFDVKAVNFAAYGASFVYLDDKGGVIAPLYNYQKSYPKKLQDQFYKTYGGERVVARQTASPVLGNLNSGMQLYRLKYEKPDVFKKIRHALHLPQYLSYILSSRLNTDITSIGCHTNLWDFRQNNYHKWVKQEGILEKFPPLLPCTEVAARISSSPPAPLQMKRGAPCSNAPFSILEKGRDEEEYESPTVFVNLPPQLLANARALRKNKTDAENLLWQLLRNRQLNGFKFRRQHPLPKGFILDFYCAEVKLAVELDGTPHLKQEQKEYDEQRTYVLKEYGIRVIRFWNEEVMNNTEQVLRKIAKACLKISLPLFYSRPSSTNAPFSSFENGRDEEDTIAVGAGLHDSSAALIPYLFTFREPFILLSTGTWCISLNPCFAGRQVFNQSQLTDYELEHDCLCYLSYEGKPVKASRLFAGYEHEQQVKRLAEHFNKPLNHYTTVSADSELLRKTKQSREQLQKNEQSVMAGPSAFAKRALTDFSHYEAAYNQLIADIIVQQTRSTNMVLKGTHVKKIFVDGGFANNSIYMQLLALSFPEIEIYAASVAQASAMGAALAIHKEWNPLPVPSDMVKLKQYKAEDILNTVV